MYLATYFLLLTSYGYILFIKTGHHRLKHLSVFCNISPACWSFLSKKNVLWLLQIYYIVCLHLSVDNIYLFFCFSLCLFFVVVYYCGFLLQSWYGKQCAKGKTLKKIFFAFFGKYEVLFYSRHTCSVLFWFLSTSVNTFFPPRHKVKCPSEL